MKYIEYTNSKNKKVFIEKISTLKNYCTRNSIDFLELMIKQFNFSVFAINRKIDIYKCRLCNNTLKINKTDEKEKRIDVSLCSCCVDTPLSINKHRFETIFLKEEVDEIYVDYVKRQTVNFKPYDYDNSSLNYFTRKFGKHQGLIKYKEKRAKCNTVGINYFINKANGDIELAKKFQKQRQKTFSLEKCIEKHGEIEGRKKMGRKTRKMVEYFIFKIR